MDALLAFVVAEWLYSYNGSFIGRLWIHVNSKALRDVSSQARRLFRPGRAWWEGEASCREGSEEGFC